MMGVANRCITGDRKTCRKIPNVPLKSPVFFLRYFIFPRNIESSPTDVGGKNLLAQCYVMLTEGLVLVFSKFIWR